MSTEESPRHLQPRAYISGGKRLAVERTESANWDWFVGVSPRNGYGALAEGTWSHWADLAVSILLHPATALVRPEAREALIAAGVAPLDQYDESNRDLSDAELDLLFPRDAAS